MPTTSYEENEVNFYWGLLLLSSICITCVKINYQSLLFFPVVIQCKNFLFIYLSKLCSFLSQIFFFTTAGNVYFIWSIPLSYIWKIILIWICDSFSGSDPWREKYNFGKIEIFKVSNSLILLLKNMQRKASFSWWSFPSQDLNAHWNWMQWTDKISTTAGLAGKHMLHDTSPNQN